MDESILESREVSQGNEEKGTIAPPKPPVRPMSQINANQMANSDEPTSYPSFLSEPIVSGDSFQDEVKESLVLPPIPEPPKGYVEWGTDSFQRSEQADIPSPESGKSVEASTSSKSSADTWGMNRETYLAREDVVAGTTSTSDEASAEAEQRSAFDDSENTEKSEWMNEEKREFVAPPVPPIPRTPVLSEVDKMESWRDNQWMQEETEVLTGQEDRNEPLQEESAISTVEGTTSEGTVEFEEKKPEFVTPPVPPAPRIPSSLKTEIMANEKLSEDIDFPVNQEVPPDLVAPVVPPMTTEIEKTNSDSTPISEGEDATPSSVISDVKNETTKAETTAPEVPPNSVPSEGVKSSAPSENGAGKEVKKNMDYKSASFLEDLFSNENECVTLPNGAFPVKDETRALLALFSNGRFFVAESAKFDGKVLGFEYLARRRHLQISDPEYVPSIVINDIYEFAAKNMATKFVQPVVESDSQEQVRMQRDFVTIISRAAMMHVSDIHIVVADHTTVMFRVNGLMQTEMEYNKDWGESFVRAAFASSDISDANYAQNEYQAAQKLGRTPLRGSNGRLNLPRNILGIRLQFNPIAFGSRYVVMRLLYAEEDSDAATDLEALGFTKRERDLFYQMRAIPTGMIVISGPTGSGKSTTLQRNMIAMLQERKYEINLITVEDPPEYPIPGARQMPVTNAMVEDAKEREFTKALSAALRSDPDALMIGEIRTLSAADLAFRGALSGHNVWTTLHANSAPATLMRLKDIGVEDFKLQDPSIMKGLMAQRLFRKLCPDCRIKAINALNHPAVQRLRRAFGDVALEQCYLRGEGCENCDFRGVKGRIAVAEFIQPDATFLDLSIRGEFKKAISYWVNDMEGVTLRDSALSKMLQGTIDIEEVERWTGFLDQQVIA